MTDETNLIQRASRFEEAALAEIYDAYSPGVYRYAQRLLGDVQLAEDCVSDTFLRFLQALHSKGGPDQHIQAYLFRIAHNWITDYYRRQQPPNLILLDEIPSGEDDLLHTITVRTVETNIRGALMLLTSDQRQVIILKYLEGWENETVARMMEKPVGAIKALQHRALNTLRRLLIPTKEEIYG